MLAGLNAPKHLIAGAVGIRKVATLERLYAKEIEDGPAAVQLECRIQLLKAAKSAGAGKVSAAIKLAELLGGKDGESNKPIIIYQMVGDDKL